MACSVSVEMDAPPIASDDQPIRDVFLPRCSDCTAPMLLMSATQALRQPITIRKTYQCMVCDSVEVVVAPLFD